MSFKIYYALIILLLFQNVKGQDISVKGVPDIHNYSPADYLNAGKIWDIESASDGILYMASNSGLLQFDGLEWSAYHGSKGITRSVKVISDSIIYTGSDLDFGVWKKNKNGVFKYKSLYPFKSEVDEGIEEFWNIYSYQNQVFFLSSQNIYSLKNNQLTKISAPSQILESFMLNDSIFVMDKQEGLLLFKNLKLRQFNPAVNKSNYIFKGAYKLNNQLHLITENSGIFKLKNNKLELLDNNLSKQIKKVKVFSYEIINENYLVFGTVFKGAYIANKNGEILHKINRYKGLQNNTILSMHYAKNGKLWVGLDYGVSSVNLNSIYTYFNDLRGEFGTAYSAKLFNNDFYLGTNQGLFYSNWKNLSNNKEYYEFDFIPGTEGQVWALCEFDNELIIGHDKGLFSYSNALLKAIDSKTGVWEVKKHKNFLFTGTYNGISIYHKKNNLWKFKNKLKSISGSCKQLIFKNDSVLWVNIPKFAIVKLIIDEELKLKKSSLIQKYDSLHRLMYLTKTNDSIYLIINNKHVKLLKNNTLLNSNIPVERFKTIGLSPDFHYSRINDNYEFHPIYNGFALKQLNKKSISNISNLKPVIKAEVFNNHKNKVLKENEKIKYKFNNLRIKYILPNYDNVLYEYKLRKSDKWSELTTKNELEFYDLDFGKYNIQIRAKLNSQVSESATFSLTVLKPVPLTWQALVLYFVFLLLLISLIYWRNKNVLAKHKNELILDKEKSLKEQEEKYKKYLSRIKQERLQKDNQQLTEQLRNKTVELANKSKDNIEINNLLIEIKEKLSDLQNKPRLSQQKIREVIKLLNKQINNDDHTFEIQMDELHQEFFKKIKNKYPDLSTNDLKLCAYLKVGLSSKEISTIMDIKLASSYINRSRLRKKLNLNADENLYDYLNSI